MHEAFTTFASSRFIDREKVVEALRRIAVALKDECAEIVAVHLFGSLATGRATPRSDADIVVEIAADESRARQEVRERAEARFLEAPVPVDLFLLSSRQLASGRGVAAAARREGIRLGGETAACDG